MVLEFISEFNILKNVFQERAHYYLMMPWIVCRLSNENENIHLNYYFHLFLLNHRKDYERASITVYLFTTHYTNLSRCFCYLHLKVNKLKSRVVLPWTISFIEIAHKGNLKLKSRAVWCQIPLFRIKYHFLWGWGNLCIQHQLQWSLFYNIGTTVKFAACWRLASSLCMTCSR